MSGTTPELSVAAGGIQVTDADVLPRSAVAMIFRGQFENIGPKMSVKSKNNNVFIIIVIFSFLMKGFLKSVYIDIYI